VDNVLVLSRSEQVRTLATTQRIGEDLDETILTLDKSTQRVDLGPTRHEAEQAEVAAAIESALKGAIELTERELGTHLEGRTEVKRTALRKLLADGKITRQGGGKRGDAFRYRLADASAPLGVVAREREPHMRRTDPSDILAQGFGEVA
jgi:hypothetical protein